eukprot:8051152-Alexandrium_andersonii.AAC.1
MGVHRPLQGLHLGSHLGVALLETGVVLGGALLGELPGGLQLALAVVHGLLVQGLELVGVWVGALTMVVVLFGPLVVGRLLGLLSVRPRLAEREVGGGVHLDRCCHEVATRLLGEALGRRLRLPLHKRKLLGFRRCFGIRLAK